MLGLAEFSLLYIRYFFPLLETTCTHAHLVWVVSVLYYYRLSSCIDIIITVADLTSKLCVESLEKLSPQQKRDDDVTDNSWVSDSLFLLVNIRLNKIARTGGKVEHDVDEFWW